MPIGNDFLRMLSPISTSPFLAIAKGLVPAVLTPLTSKSCNALFPTWTHQHEAAFVGIKNILTGTNCLTMIDNENLGKNKIWVTCDASQ